MEKTVTETMAVEKLRFWKLQEFITSHQAAMLALGLDPGKELFDCVYNRPTHQGYEPIKSSLEAKLTTYHYNRLDEESGKTTVTYDALFCPENIHTPSDALFCPENIHTPSIDSNGNEFSSVSVYRIRQKVIKLWLEEQGIYSGYFAGLQLDSNKTKPVEETITSRPVYQTKLMEIMYKTIERYYGENYDPEDRESVPPQLVVVEWLQTTYALSEAKAKSIDKMTRPDNVKRPKGKT